MAVKTISPQQAYAKLSSGELRLIDIRQSYELLTGMAQGAEAIEQAVLEQRQYQQEILDADSSIALICQRGIRSAELGQYIMRENDVEVFSVDGGMHAWKAAELPLHWPQSELNRDERERYLRHLALPQIGLEGQLKLRKGRVLLIGAGGLGSPAALYLAAAGVGHIGIVDDDVVELSNLQRQILHSTSRLGQAKVESAKTHLLELNDQIDISVYPQRLTAENIEEIVTNYDLVLDGSDNFPTRYLVNATCIRFGKPLVYGAVQQFSGQVSVFHAAADNPSPCYGCLFPESASAEDAPNCAQAGVLGVVPGVIACLQATEAIKYLLGVGELLLGRLLVFDALAMRFRELRIPRDPKCDFCS
ncbi:MAG: molybdopterin-synthase adenylyltransferase MoeB [Pseudomonadota bacterium]